MNYDTHASVYPENFLPLFLVIGWPSSSTIKSSISVGKKHKFKLMNSIPHHLESRHSSIISLLFGYSKTDLTIL